MRDRATLLTTVALVSGLAAGSYWLSEQAKRNDPGKARLTHEVDFYAERFSLVRMNENGIPQYSIHATRMDHYADDDSSTLEKPAIVAQKPERPVVTLNADRGQMNSDAEDVHLYGHVAMKRAATATATEMFARSDYFLAQTELDILRTDQPVQITQGRSVINALSMEYDNGYQMLKLNEQVKGRGKAHLVPRGQSASSLGDTPLAGPTTGKS